MASAETDAVGHRIRALFLPHWRRLVVALTAVCAASGFGVLAPFVVQAVFDRALFPHDGKVDLTALMWLLAALGVISVATSGATVFQTYQTTLLGNRIMADLRVRLFHHLQRMDLGFFTTTRSGVIQSRLVNDVSGVQSVLSETAPLLVANSTSAISALVAMALLDWRLALISLVAIPGFVILNRRVANLRRNLVGDIQESMAQMMAVTSEALSISGILLSKLFNNQALERRRYAEENDRQVILRTRLVLVSQTLAGIMQAFLGFCPALVYLAAGLFVYSGGHVSIGTIAAITTLQARLLYPTASLLDVSLNIGSSLAVFTRIFEYLDLRPLVSDRPNARALDSDHVQGRLSVRNAWFRYSNANEALVEPSSRGEAASEVSSSPEAQAWALRDVSFDVAPGEFVAIVGPSGAGKTSLSYLIPRLYDVTRGSIQIDGVDVRELIQSSICDTVGMVTQDTYLIHATIAENLRYAKPGASQEQIEHASRIANIHDRISSFPDGYNTMVGERGYRLSGGEKQRLAIARVLLKDPPILILDEATSSLDTANERLVQQAFERVSQRRTTIAIAHRLSTVINADKILVLDGGELVEHGTHAELMVSRGLYSRLYDQQFGTPPATKRPGSVEVCLLSSQT